MISHLEEDENQILNKLLKFPEVQDRELFRLISLKQGFPNVFYTLMHPSIGDRSPEFELTRKHFPYFLVAEDLELSLQ
jgi:hypothetical protein